jgi:hypothetical protein
MQHRVSFTGEFSPNFDLYTKDIFMEEMTQISQILKNCFLKSPDFYDKFPVGSQEYKKRHPSMTSYWIRNIP